MTRTTKVTIISIIIVIAGIGLVYQLASSDSSAESAQEPSSVRSQATTTGESTPTVEAINTELRGGNTVVSSGSVRGQLSATISSQSSGVIERVPVTIGQQVSRGDTLAAFANDSERASVRQAQANVETREANLEELQSGSRRQEVRSAEISVESARNELRSAEQDLLNTDLQAYVADGDENVRSGSLQSPAISGSYTGNQKGEYRISLYKSGAKSGYSFRYTGLEAGIGTVSTETPQPLGSRGLYVQFPEDFASSRMLEWVVPVPNTRSQQFIGAQNRVDQARTQLQRAENDLDLMRDGTRQEQISSAEAQLSAAEASLQQARAQLNKTTVDAPFSGRILSVPVDPGSYVGVGQPVVKLVNSSRIEIRTQLAPQTVRQLSVGDSVEIEGSIDGRIAAIAPAVDPETGNIEVRVTAQDAAREALVPGTFADLRFPTAGTESNSVSLPLSAIGTTADNSYVLVVSSDDRLERVMVETGPVTGETASVDKQLPDRPIVQDISGLNAGQKVILADESNSTSNESK